MQPQPSAESGERWLGPLSPHTDDEVVVAMAVAMEVVMEGGMDHEGEGGEVMPLPIITIQIQQTHILARLIGFVGR